MTPTGTKNGYARLVGPAALVGSVTAFAAVSAVRALRHETILSPVDLRVYLMAARRLVDTGSPYEPGAIIAGKNTYVYPPVPQPDAGAVCSCSAGMARCRLVPR